MSKSLSWEKAGINETEGITKGNSINQGKESDFLTFDSEHRETLLLH